MEQEYRKQEKDLTDKDKELYEWIDCTTYEESARGERWVIRGIGKFGWEIVIPAKTDGS